MPPPPPTTSSPNPRIGLKMKITMQEYSSSDSSRGDVNEVLFNRLLSVLPILTSVSTRCKMYLDHVLVLKLNYSDVTTSSKKRERERVYIGLPWEQAQYFRVQDKRQLLVRASQAIGTQNTALKRASLCWLTLFFPCLLKNCQSSKTNEIEKKKVNTYGENTVISPIQITYIIIELHLGDEELRTKRRLTQHVHRSEMIIEINFLVSLRSILQ